MPRLCPTNFEPEKVKSVSPGSEAEKAGLRETDLITHIKGEAVQVMLYLISTLPRLIYGPLLGH